MLLASTSTEGGLTGSWSKPSLVNPPNDKAAFTAAIAVNTRGQVGVTYYDFTPPLRSRSVLLTDTWFAATYGPGLDFGPRQLIGGPFNMEAQRRTPAASSRVTTRASRRGYPTLQEGDHLNGPDDSGAGFVSLSVMSNCANNSCVAQGSLDGSPVGPDSTNAFSVAGLRS